MLPLVKLREPFLFQVSQNGTQRAWGNIGYTPSQRLEPCQFFVPFTSWLHWPWWQQRPWHKGNMDIQVASTYLQQKQKCCALTLNMKQQHLQPELTLKKWHDTFETQCASSSMPSYEAISIHCTQTVILACAQNSTKQHYKSKTTSFFLFQATAHMCLQPKWNSAKTLEHLVLVIKKHWTKQMQQENLTHKPHSTLWYNKHPSTVCFKASILSTWCLATHTDTNSWHFSFQVWWHHMWQ